MAAMRDGADGPAPDGETISALAGLLPLLGVR